MTEEQIGPSIVELITSRDEWFGARGRTTVFDSTGFALEDYVALQLALKHAFDFNLGREIRMDFAIGDPWNPYAGVDEFIEAIATR